MDKQNRKDRIRTYRETAKPMGVYRVHSSNSGHSVIGTSPDLPSALNRQRAQLSMGTHPDKALQREWDEHGAGALEFEILDTLEPRDEPDYDPTADLDELKELWLGRLVQE